MIDNQKMNRWKQLYSLIISIFVLNSSRLEFCANSFVPDWITLILAASRGLSDSDESGIKIANKQDSAIP